METPPTRDEPARRQAGPRADTSGDRPSGSSPGPSPWRSAGRALAAGIAAFLLSHLLARVPWLVEATYGRVAGPAVAWLLSWITAPFPFPVAELALAAYVGWLLALAVGALWEVARGPGANSAAGTDGAARAGAGAGPAETGSRLRALRRRAGRGAARVVRHGGVLLATFYLLWGFHYARPPVEARMGLPEGAGADRAELITLAERAVEATNDAYRAVHGTEDAGAPTEMTTGRDAMKRALEAGWRRAAEETGLPALHGWSFGPAKTFVPDGFLVKIGLGGFYFPWTGEAVVDGGTPASDLVQSVAHEQAHQRGVAPEDEASFLGFLAASRAPSPVARYSALLFAQRHLVAAASSGGRPDLRDELTADRLPGVTRDLRDLHEYLRRRIDPAVRVTRRVNDAYLKSNRVEGGVASYGLVTRLLVARSRDDGERLFPGEGGGPRSDGTGGDGAATDTPGTGGGAGGAGDD